MTNTRVDIQGERFLINSRLTYSQLSGCDQSRHGLLMNARFIQGVFDDRASPERFARFGYDRWDAAANTARLIAALPHWYAHGLRAFTVGFQGGGPCFTTDNHSIDNNPFGPDGRSIDASYAARMDRLIAGADECGMVVIVSLLYQGQIRRLEGDDAIRRAVAGGARCLADGGYTNVILEVANEYDVGDFRKTPIVSTASGMVELMRIARREAPSLPVGCSGGGGSMCREIAESSDVILVHGNGQTRQQLANLVERVRLWAPARPVVCNEDSPCASRLEPAFAGRFSWGYYNNLTKQEPPAEWGIARGEDRFFATRMAEGLGIDPVESKAVSGSDGTESGDGGTATAREEYYLAGFEPRIEAAGKRWIRLAALRPEQIDRVDFVRSGKPVATVWDEPFSIGWQSNWMHSGVTADFGLPAAVTPAASAGGDTPWGVRPGAGWSALVHLASGETVEVAPPEGSR